MRNPNQENYIDLLNNIRHNNCSNINNFKYELYEFFWNTDECQRNGAMSMVSCDNISNDSRYTTEDLLNSINNYKQRYITNISAVSNYLGNNLQKYCRIIKFKNKLKLRILNCDPDNYSGRLIFRQLITKILLGDDYDFSFTEGCYKDGSLGQEVIYYLFEIYNYDRYWLLHKLYYKILKKHIINNPNISFENFYNDKSINIIYPSIDGIYYYDSSETNIESKNIIINGTELLVFIPELCFSIEKCICYNLDSPYHFNVSLSSKEEFIEYLNEFINKYNQLNININYSINLFKIINEKMIKECKNIK